MLLVKESYLDDFMPYIYINLHALLENEHKFRAL